MATISTVDNALDSLRRMAAELPPDAADPLSLKAPLGWGWHAIVLLTYHRLRPARDSFDHWLWPFLETGEPELDVERDAGWEERQRLSLLQILDMLSAENLEILDPQFYQGWQDKTTRCRTLRQRVASVLLTSLDDSTRAGLLRLLAAYHRLLRIPTPVGLDTGAAAADLPALLDLADMLVDRSHDHSAPLLEAIQVCRARL